MNNDGDFGGTPTQFNFKQSVAFRLTRRHIVDVKVHGQNNVKQLYSIFLEQYFVLAAATSAKAAYLINGKTLLNLPYLPVGTSKILPLQGEMLNGMHDTFSNVDILFKHEKSIVGQKIFTMVSKRLQGRRTHHKVKPFGNLSVVLLGDFNQLPPVCDSQLFKANA